MALELKSITKRVGAETIDETDLVLAERGFDTLLGTTLSGKTTLMKLMAGIDKPTSGEVWFRGANVTDVAVQKRNVSMVYRGSCTRTSPSTRTSPRRCGSRGCESARSRIVSAGSPS